MARPLIVDGATSSTGEACAAAGFVYEGIGRAVEASPSPTVAD